MQSVSTSIKRTTLARAFENNKTLFIRGKPYLISALEITPEGYEAEIIPIRAYFKLIATR